MEILKFHSKVLTSYLPFTLMPQYAVLLKILTTLREQRNREI